MDSHLIALHGENNLQLFSKLSYEKKIFYLYTFAGPLADLNEERTRIEGMTQSYNVNDSLLMKDSRELKHILDEKKNTYSLQHDEAMGNQGGIKRKE